ncbi:unknown [Clostridium sp. CAG:452]|nr:unknown [Clostridium sp. CAG:452]
MKLLKVKGVVIAEKIVSDFDKIVTILTPNIRKNRSCSKRLTKTKEPSSWCNSIFVLWRISFI